MRVSFLQVCLVFVAVCSVFGEQVDEAPPTRYEVVQQKLAVIPVLDYMSRLKRYTMDGNAQRTLDAPTVVHVWLRAFCVRRP